MNSIFDIKNVLYTCQEKYIINYHNACNTTLAKRFLGMKNQQLNQEFFMEKGSIVEFILNLSAMDFTYQNNTGFLISKYIKKEKNNYKEIVKKLGCYLDNKN